MTRTILCYGDSNTFGTMPMASLSEDGRHGHDARWPSVMAKVLGVGFEVIAEGLPGRTSLHDDPIEGAHRNGLSVLPAVMESHRPLDLVILMLGTNDLKQRFSVGAGDIALSLGRLIEAIKTSTTGPGGRGPLVLLVCPPPIREIGELGEMFAGGALKSASLSGACARVAERLGVPMVNARTLIEVSDIDGIHFSAEAQQRLGLAMVREVQDHFFKT